MAKTGRYGYTFGFGSGKNYERGGALLVIDGLERRLACDESG